MKISHEERFTGREMFAMFSVDVPYTNKAGKPKIAKLWHEEKRTPKRGEEKALGLKDFATDENQIGLPGSAERIAAYAKSVENGRELFTPECDEYASQLLADTAEKLGMFGANQSGLLERPVARKELAE